MPRPCPFRYGRRFRLPRPIGYVETRNSTILPGVTDAIGGPAPAWSLRLNSQLDAADQRATVVARGLTPQQLNWSRSPAEWSVGQCLEHLAFANAVYLRAMSRSLEGRRAGLVEEIAPRSEERRGGKEGQ